MKSVRLSWPSIVFFKLEYIISLRSEDFKLFENGCIQRKKGSPIPKLGEIKSVQFRKGLRKMFFKQELENEEFLESSILKPKFKLELSKSVSTQFGLVMANDLQILVFVSVIEIISSLDIFHFQSIYKFLSATSATKIYY
jgi:hypothetical protein